SVLSVLVSSVIVLLMTSNEIKPYVPSYLFRLMLKFKEFLSADWGKLGADLSYSFYLIHSPILSVGLYLAMLLGLENKVMTAAVGFFIFLTITLTLSWLLFIAVEKPFIKIGRDLISKYN